MDLQGPGCPDGLSVHFPSSFYPRRGLPRPGGWPNRASHPQVLLELGRRGHVGGGHRCLEQR